MSPAVALFAGVAPQPGELELAEEAGAVLARAGYRILHGGYNGVMEAAARGAAAHGARVTALTLADRGDWGPFNRHVTDTRYASTMGERLHAYLDDAELIVALGGGVGTLHEITAALYYATSIRTLPVRLLGQRACGLARVLRADRWLVETPTRPLGFLRELPDAAALERDLAHWGTVR
ncbi:LOG family protein [Streptomyces sp. NPDC007025]|uniref:SLOG cluster 4 domain-containing protein n=1 Tax=Streptomyces sp. NPDC007025 TaxID=3364771 RepID=UPI003694CAC7